MSSPESVVAIVQSYHNLTCKLILQPGGVLCVCVCVANGLATVSSHAENEVFRWRETRGDCCDSSSRRRQECLQSSTTTDTTLPTFQFVATSWCCVQHHRHPVDHYATTGAGVQSSPSLVHLAWTLLFALHFGVTLLGVCWPSVVDDNLQSGSVPCLLPKLFNDVSHWNLPTDGQHRPGHQANNGTTPVDCNHYHNLDVVLVHSRW